MLVFFLIPLVQATGLPCHAVESLKLQRLAIDLGSYRGYWRIETAGGKEISRDECFTQRVCRETLKGLADGDYALVLSGQPQSIPVRFKVAAGSLIVTSGANLASADGMTLRLKGLRRVVFDTNGYRGAWSLDLWKGAEATGFFKRDGSEQAIELFPETTYILNIGSFASERFQIGRDDRIVLIDDSGAVRVSTEAVNRIVLQTIDVAFYPVPLPDTAQWMIEGLPPPDGRATYTGPRILRLAQGTKYKLTDPASETGAVVSALASGKACNMTAQSFKLAKITISATPIAASCNTGIRSAAPQ